MATPATAPLNSSRRQCTRRSSSRYGIEVHSTSPASTDSGMVISQLCGRVRTKARTPYSIEISASSTSRAIPEYSPLRLPAFGSPHASR